MNQYQQKIKIDEVPDYRLSEIVGMLLERLNLEIIREETPDYTSFELQSRRGDGEQSGRETDGR